MKKLPTALVLAFTFGLLLSIPKAYAVNDEAEIRQLLDNWAKAFRVHDIRAIMLMYAPEVVAYDIVPPLKYAGAEAYRKDYEEFLAQYDGPIEVEYSDLKIVVGGDVAFAYGLERLSGTMKIGQRSDIWVRFTSGFRKINGRWFDVHDHISVPVDLQTGKAALDLKP
jgi:ketosteroid isomerase-like protein